MLCQALSIISKPPVNSNWSNNPEMLNLSKIWQFFVPCELEIRWMTSKNNRAPFLCYLKLSASFHGHRSIHISYSPETLNSGKKNLSCVTLKFKGCRWKAIGHPFYATSSFVHHFVAISQFKLELQSGNSVQNRQFFIQYDLKIWRRTLKK